MVLHVLSSVVNIPKVMIMKILSHAHEGVNRTSDGEQYFLRMPALPWLCSAAKLHANIQLSIRCRSEAGCVEGIRSLEEVER